MLARLQKGETEQNEICKTFGDVLSIWENTRLITLTITLKIII